MAREHVVDGCQRLALAIQIRQRLGAPQMSVYEIGLPSDRPIEAHDCLGVPAKINEGRPAVEPVLDHIGRQGQGPIITVDRFGIAAECAQRIGPVTMRLRKLGGQRNGAIKARQRFLVLPKRGQSTSQQNTRAGVVRIAGQRLARVLGTVGKAAVLARHHAKVVMGVGVTRISPQHLAISRRRFGGRPAPVQRQPLLQQIRCRNDHIRMLADRPLDNGQKRLSNSASASR